MGKSLDKKISVYFSKIGKKGGTKSRRKLSPEQARAMVKRREEIKNNDFKNRKNRIKNLK